MRTAASVVVDEALWEATLLSAESELLLGAARNYLGPVKTPYDKRDIVARLRAFLSRAETRRAVLELLDGLDARILASLFLLGPLPEAELRSLFEGELPLFDLGVRLANLQDRLLVFRFEQGGRRLLAPNPVLAEDLRSATLDPATVFGAGSPGAAGPGRTGAAAKASAGPARLGGARNASVDAGGDGHAAGGAAAREAPPVSAADAVALFDFLFQFPGSIRKGGNLTKKAQERALSILPESLRGGSGGAGAADDGLQGQARTQGAAPSEAAAALAAALGMAEPSPAATALAGGRIGSLLEAFDAAGFLGSDGDAREADLAAFSAALEAWGERLPAYLAASLAAGPEEEDPAWPRQGDRLEADGAILAEALAAAPAGFAFTRGGLGRWLETALRRGHRGSEAQPVARRRDLIEALLGLGLVEEEGGACFVRAPWPRLADAAMDEASLPAGGPAGDAGAAAGGPAGKASLVAEGSHAIHLMPEAGLEERLFLGVMARPVSFGQVWSFEVDRESARRAFSAGLGAAGAVERIARYAKRPLPQSLTFSLKAWEEEFRALRFYRGYVLVADERLRPVIERSRALAPRIAERLAPGVYVLAVSGPEEAAELIEEAGLEPPPETHYGPASRPAFPAGGAAGRGIAQAAPALPPGPGALEAADRNPDAAAASAFRLARAAVSPLAALVAPSVEGGGGGADALCAAGAAADATAQAAQEGSPASAARVGPAPRRPRFDPRPRLELLAAALDATAFGVEDFPDEEGEAAGAGAAGGGQDGAGLAGGARGGAAGPQSAPSPRQRPPRGPAELRELSDRIERRLILTPRQLLRADVKPEHLEAGGLDYLGKVRIVERALRGPGNRLEILYRLSGAEPARVLARPVRLEKAEKGLVLEAEDLGTGSPLRIPLGAMSSVRMMRASLFGDDK